jgi:hypothetical protein
MKVPAATPSPAGATSPGDVAAEIASLSGGLGILALPLFPFALPGLLLVVPLVLLAVPPLLLAGILMLPFWLIRLVRRGWTRRRARAEVRAADRTSAARPPRLRAVAGPPRPRTRP